MIYHLPHVGLRHAPIRDFRGTFQRGESGQGAVCGHLQLLCLPAGQGQRFGGEGGLPQVFVHTGALQLDFPGGRAGDGQALRRGQHRHDALQRLGRGQALQAPGRDLQAAGGGQLRQV